MTSSQVIQVRSLEYYSIVTNILSCFNKIQKAPKVKHLKIPAKHQRNKTINKRNEKLL
jgi:hypothetical protein